MARKKPVKVIVTLKILDGIVGGIITHGSYEQWKAWMWDNTKIRPMLTIYRHQLAIRESKVNYRIELSDNEKLIVKQCVI